MHLSKMVAGKHLDASGKWKIVVQTFRARPELLPMTVFVGTVCAIGAVFLGHSLYFKPDVWVRKSGVNQPYHSLAHDDVRKYFNLSTKPQLRPDINEGDTEEIRQLRKEIGF